MIRWLRRHSFGAGLIAAGLLAIVSGVLLGIWTKDAALVVSAVFGVAVGGLVSMAAELARKHLERREQLSALATLLWADLGMASLRIERAPGIVTEEIDISLWKDIRVKLIQAGMPGQVMANLILVYAFADKWNRSEALLETVSDPKAVSKAIKYRESMRETLLGVIPVATHLIRPYVPEELRSIVDKAREDAPPKEREPQA